MGPTARELPHKVTLPPRWDLRALFVAIAAGHDLLRSQIDVLRADANVLIDRRPLLGGLHVVGASQVVQALSPP